VTEVESELAAKPGGGGGAIG